ncbi:MAG: ABC transporter substrate-binding protein, partial [Rhizobiales bacterium]|nr:ABC transporter substrate-binding protein [Hyphomicrobiales bacterium]
IKSIEDMRGHSVGLWFGGDEQEFLAMLDRAGIPQSDVNIISQGYDIVSWLNKDYDVMQVARYNELLQVYRHGYKKEDLVFLEPPADSMMVSGGLFTTEKEIKEHPEVVQAVVDATLRGWQDAIADPKAAAEIVVKHNSELKVDEQVEQIKAMGDLFCAGPTLDGEFGKSELKNYEVAQKILISAKLIDQTIECAMREGLTSRAAAIGNAKDLYAQMQLPDPDSIGARFPHQVSGGQLQRAMTAMAMTCRPDLIVFDEPTTALDVTTQVEVLASIRRIVEEHHTAALYITHDLAVVAQMAHRIMVLRHGELVEEADTQTMLSAPRQPYTRSLWAVRTMEKQAEVKRQRPADQVEHGLPRIERGIG